MLETGLMPVTGPRSKARWLDHMSLDRAFPRTLACVSGRLKCFLQQASNARLLFRGNGGVTVVGTLIGMVVGAGICVQAVNGQLHGWSIGALVGVVLLGFIFPVTVGTFLTGVAIASPFAAILGFVTGNGSSGWAAIAIGALAFGGQLIIGSARKDTSEFRRYAPRRP